MKKDLNKMTLQELKAEIEETEKGICEFQGREWGCAIARHYEIEQGMIKRVSKEFNNTHQQEPRCKSDCPSQREGEWTSSNEEGGTIRGSFVQYPFLAGVHPFIEHSRGSK